jgi:hypothetical protein
MIKKIRLTESDFIGLIKKIIKEQYEDDYTQSITNKMFSKQGLDYIKSLGEQGFMTFSNPKTNEITRAKKGDISIDLTSQLRCDSEDQSPIQVTTPDVIYQGCKGSNVTYKLLPSKKVRSVVNPGKMDNPPVKKINKDITTIIDQLT